jgi:hypothetical protein
MDDAHVLAAGQQLLVAQLVCEITGRKTKWLAMACCGELYGIRGVAQMCTYHTLTFCHVLLLHLLRRGGPLCPPAGVFSPGQPAAFHHNYLSGAALLAAVEGLGRSRKAVERCRGSAAAASWAKRWNLAVYFSLLYQDIAGEWRVWQRPSPVSSTT